MTAAYLESIDAENEISALILEISGISYRIKEDWTPELPEVTIVTHSTLFEKGQRIIIAQSSDTTKQVMFYIKEITYDYTSRKYTLTCPHILEKLADVKVTELPAPAYGDPFGDWSDVTPTGDDGYYLYNMQSDHEGQGDFIFERQYYQVLFLLKMMIHYVTGVGVDTLDSTLIDEVDSFYKKTWEYYGAHEQVYKYGELGVNITGMRYAGSSAYNQYDDPDFFVRSGMMSCLELMKWLLCALGIRIDIFREDYQMDVIASSDEPADADQIGRTDAVIEQYRRYGVKRSGLDETEDYVFGYYDEGGEYHAWTWGVTDPDKEILTFEAEIENEEVTEAKEILVTFPNLFRIYAIYYDEANHYRSKIIVIDDAIAGKTDWDHWLDAFYAYWSVISGKNTHKTAMSGIEMRWVSTALDIASLTMQFERLI